MSAVLTPVDDFPTDRQVAQLRIPPHSIEAESSVLGGLLLDNSAWDRVGDLLSDGNFYRYEHRLIYAAIGALINASKPADVITVFEHLQNLGKAEEVGGLGYLNSLAQYVPSASNIRRYAEIVRDKSVLRKLIDAGSEITGNAFEPEGRSTQDVLEHAEQLVFRIAEAGARGRQGFVPMRSAVKEAFDLLRQRFESKGAVTGLPTGFPDLDVMTAGLQPSDLIILAARPSMGKTSLAVNMAEYAALKSKKAVAIFSMEMSASQLAFRLISAHGRINQQHLRTGDLQDEEWPRVTSAITLLGESKIFIDDTPGLSPVELRSRSRRLRKEHDLGLIVVDYLQLMTVPGNKENRATEISEITRGLKALAKELNVPVLALSQLNRSLEQRTDKRPVMADLRESGAIEQDADLILFIYRDEVYNKESPDKGLAELIIGKQRNGPTGLVKLTFLGQYTKFENHATQDYSGHFG